MNRTTIYTRTEKGTHLAASASHSLASDLRRLLEAIDGTSSVEALLARLDFLSAASLDEALAALVADDLIRDVEAVQAEHSERKAQELRAKIKARREGTERSAHDAGSGSREEEEELRQLVEEQARREAAERARQEAEAQAQRLAAELARRDAEDKARREAEARTKKLAEEQAQREAAERARQAAEAQAQRLAEELARRDAEEKARREADDRARQEAEAQARRDAEEEARREAERVRQEAEEKARAEADEKAWREAEEKFRREEKEAAEAARKRAAAKDAKVGSTKPQNLLLLGGLGLVALMVVGLVAIHLISYDGQIPKFEKAAAAQFQQPVRIKALRLSLLPRVQLRLEDVSIGAEGQIKVPQINATGDLGNLFSDKKVFKSVEVDSPVVTEAGLAWILFGKPATGDVVTGQVSVSNARLESKNISLPAFGAKLQSDGAGAWKTIVIESEDKGLNVELTPKGESVQIDFKARSFRLPFGSSLALDELVASGVADRTQLSVTEFKGYAYGGVLSGNAVLKWGAQWSLAGELNAKQMDMARLVPGLMDGRLVGSAAYAMQAPEAGKLFAENRLEGNLVVARGTLMGVDLGRMVQGGAISGETKFTELAGGFLHDRGATQLRQVRLTEGAITANGAAEVDAEGNVRGRFAVDLKMSAEQRRANLVVAGNLKKIEWRRP